jgi:hypothetical protein
LPSKRRATGCISSSRCKITRPRAMRSPWQTSGAAAELKLPDSCP